MSKKSDSPTTMPQNQVPASPKSPAPSPSPDPDIDDASSKRQATR